MARDADLLAAIRANPDDDGPRLVYADVLAERANPRGELIHLQLRRSRSRDERDECKRREKLLLGQFGATWDLEAGVRHARVRYRRGFPYVLIGNVRTILASRAALQTQPITELVIERLDSQAPAVDELAALPELAHIRKLRLEASAWSPDLRRAEPLWRSTALGGLRALELEGRVVDDEHAPLLARAPWFPQLERVVIRRVPMTNSPHVTALRALNVFEAGLAPEDAIALARSSHLRGLVELSLANNEIGAAGAKALAGSTALASLSALYVTGNAIGIGGITALARRAGLPALTRLGARGTVADESWDETQIRFAHVPDLVLV